MILDLGCVCGVVLDLTLYVGSIPSFKVIVIIADEW